MWSFTFGLTPFLYVYKSTDITNRLFCYVTCCSYFVYRVLILRIPDKYFWDSRLSIGQLSILLYTNPKVAGSSLARSWEFSENTHNRMPPSGRDVRQWVPCDTLHVKTSCWGKQHFSCTRQHYSCFYRGWGQGDLFLVLERWQSW